MIAVLIIFGLISYVVVGGVISGLINDEELEAACIFLWPLLIVFGLFAALYFLAKGFGENLGKNLISHFTKKEEDS